MRKYDNPIKSKLVTWFSVRKCRQSKMADMKMLAGDATYRSKRQVNGGQNVPIKHE